MARSVYDIAVALGVMTGVDPADAATKKSEGQFETDYTKYLKADALKGARIGIARDFLGAGPRCGLGRGRRARRDATRGRDGGGRAVSQMAARRKR